MLNTYNSSDFVVLKKASGCIFYANFSDLGWILANADHITYPDLGWKAGYLPWPMVITLITWIWADKAEQPVAFAPATRNRTVWGQGDQRLSYQLPGVGQNGNSFIPGLRPCFGFGFGFGFGFAETVPIRLHGTSVLVSA